MEARKKPRMQPVKQHTGNMYSLLHGAFWGILLEPSWVVLGASRAVLGPSWASWNALGPSWRPIRPSGALLGAFLARLVELGPHGRIAVLDPETLRERPRDLTIWAACPYKEITIMISAHRNYLRLCGHSISYLKARWGLWELVYLPLQGFARPTARGP